MRGHSPAAYWGITPWTAPLHEDERRYEDRCAGSGRLTYEGGTWTICRECGRDVSFSQLRDRKGRRKVAEHTAPESRYAQ